MQIHSAAYERALPSESPQTFTRRRGDAVVSELLSRYQECGGVASSAEIVGFMRGNWRQPISMLAQWIVSRKVVSFTNRGLIVLPLFQFMRPRMTPNECVQEVVSDLADLMDDEGLSEWFVRRNEWLGCAMPVDFVDSDPSAVLAAARQTRDRLLASGRMS